MKKNLVFQTVFSSDEKLEFIRKAKDAGFFIRFFFVCIEKPSINVLRVTNRFLTGGHEVPISKIVNRYYKSLANAAVAISIVDRAYIYDNSVDNQLPKLICRMVDGALYKQYAEILPNWVQELL